MSFSPRAPSISQPSASTPLVSSPQSPSSTSQTAPTSCFSCCSPSTSHHSKNRRKATYDGDIKQNRLKNRDELVARTACCCVSLSFLGEAAMPDCCGAGHYLGLCCAELYCQYGFEKIVTGRFLSSYYSNHFFNCFSRFFSCDNFTILMFSV